MKYIVDTHILLWTILDPGKLSQNILSVYEQADEVQASNINFWEISLKYKLGKLELGDLTPENILTALVPGNKDGWIVNDTGNEEIEYRIKIP